MASAISTVATLRRSGETIAETIDEIEMAALVPPHQIVGAKPGVAAFEDVAHDLALIVLSVLVLVLA